MMSGAERIQAVLRRQEPDQVPTLEWDIDSRLIRRLAGGGGYLDFIEQFDLDAVVCGPNYAKENLGADRIRDEWGVTRLLGEEEYPMPLDECAPIKGLSDLEQWHPPDPEKPGRLDALKAAVKRFKGRKAIVFRLRDVFSNPRDLLGYEELLVRSVAEPELVRELIEKCIAHSIRLAELAAAAGAEVVMTGDDIAGSKAPLISPACWRAVFHPYFKEFVAAVHRCGLRYWKHTDGNILALMEFLVEAGIDGIDPVDPLAGMDLGFFKREWGGRVAIKGNVDCCRLLTEGTESEVEQAVRACLAIAGPGGGYACSSSNSIHSGVRPELYVAMLRAIRQYGRYPLNF